MTATPKGKAGRPKRSEAWSDDFWLMVRAEWELDAKQTLRGAAERARDRLGLHDKRLPAVPSIKARSDREGWVKQCSVAQLNTAAHRLADSLSNDESKSTLDSIDDRAAIISQHRNDWPALRAQIAQAIEDLRTAPERAAELLERDRAAEADKPLKIRKTFSARDEISYATAVMRLARTRLEGLYTAAQAIEAVQRSERKAWGLDIEEDPTGQFTAEDRAKLDAMYESAIADAEKQASEMAERMRAIRQLASGSVH